MAKVTGLSGNEIYCMALKNYAPGELVVGNSVNSMGFLGGLAAGMKGMVGGEIGQVTQAIEEGRLKAFDRMTAEAKKEGADGVTGVTGELKDFIGIPNSCSSVRVCTVRTADRRKDFSAAPAARRNCIATWTPAISRSNTPSAISPI